MNAAAKRSKFPRAIWRSGWPAIAPSSIFIRRNRSCRCCRASSCQRGGSIRHHYGQHAGGGGDSAVHRRGRRRARPQARDRRGDVCTGGADVDGRQWRDSLSALIFWRTVQGLVLPPIFAVTIAYIGDEWPPQEATTAAGIYSSGSSLGGFQRPHCHRHSRRPDRLARRLYGAGAIALCRRGLRSRSFCRPSENSCALRV